MYLSDYSVSGLSANPKSTLNCGTFRNISKSKSGMEIGSLPTGEPILRFPDGTTYKRNSPGIDNWCYAGNNLAENDAEFFNRILQNNQSCNCADLIRAIRILTR